MQYRQDQKSVCVVKVRAWSKTKTSQLRSAKVERNFIAIDMETSDEEQTGSQDLNKFNKLLIILEQIMTFNS